MVLSRLDVRGGGAVKELVKLLLEGKELVQLLVHQLHHHVHVHRLCLALRLRVLI